MEENCKHEFKTSINDIIVAKYIFERKFKCINCSKLIQMKVSKGLVITITSFTIIFTVIFILLPLMDILSDESIFVEYGYIALIIIGITNLYLWILNGVIWLFRKRIKYIEIEEDNTKKQIT